MLILVDYSNPLIGLVDFELLEVEQYGAADSRECLRFYAERRKGNTSMAQGSMKT